ncbi:MAG: cation:proton antiporter [Firmicutes bacterium]|nr:cation:proton antiporter [Bacillota bacterium]
MTVNALRLFAILCIAFVVGKLISKIRLPAILGWLVTGILFGPNLVQIVSAEITDALWYQLFVKVFECFAGVMIGREIIFKKIAQSGKQILGITVIQALGTFLFVTLAFAVTFLIAEIPVYLAFVFGGIALATAPAPALSVVNEYHTNGPVTKTLIPLAAIDDVIGILVFFTTISVIGAVKGGPAASVLSTVGMIVFPFVIGIGFGAPAGVILRKIKNGAGCFAVFLAGLVCCIAAGAATDYFVFQSFLLNYLLIGMSFSATVANLIDGQKLEGMMKPYAPILQLSLVIVIVNLGLPLDYRLITGAGVFTAVYILSRAVGKVGFAYLGGKITKADPRVTKWLGFTLLPHSGVSLVFTGIAVNTFTAIDASLAAVISGTIVAAAIINEIIAVILAKVAFQKAGEIRPVTDEKSGAVQAEEYRER